jgi:hypothetical protein
MRLILLSCLVLLTGCAAVGSIISRKISNAAYTFYLIEPHSYSPVWKASLKIQARSYVNRNPAQVYVRKLEKSLVEGGYIVPHR